MLGERVQQEGRDVGTVGSAHKDRFTSFVRAYVGAGVLLGVLWILWNFRFIPQYGDTYEYLELSKTLTVDQYRTILYPALLHLASLLASHTVFPQQSLIYAAQLSLSAFAVYGLARLILGRPSWRIAALASVVVVTNPLVAHFSLSMMSDSFATSFTIIFMTSLLSAFGERATRARRAYCLLAAAVAFILAALTRGEKLYLVAPIFIVGAFYMATRPPFSELPTKTKVGFVFVAMTLLITATAATLWVKRETTTYNPKRPPLNLESMAFARVVWPRMEDVYRFFPAHLKASISMEEAIHFDSHANNVYPFLVKMYGTPSGKADVDEITLITLRHAPVRVGGKVVFDFIKYLLPNIAFPMESCRLLPESVATSWTISRMAMHAKILTYIYLLIGATQFVLLLAYLIYTRTKILPASKGGVVVIIAFAIILNSTMFTLYHGMDAHIRYAMPTYTLLQTLLVAHTLRLLLRNG